MSTSLEKIAKYRHHLQVLRTSTPSVQKAILKNSDADLVTAVCELCLNILMGNLELNAQSRRVLESHKTVLRHLAYDNGLRKASVTQRGRGKKNNPSVQKEAWLKRKRRYLIQKGTGVFLSTLITTALGGIVGKVISRVINGKSKEEKRE